MLELSRNGRSLAALQVLIVDPNAYMRRLLDTMLKGLGVRRIIEAADGAECVQQIRDHGPDIVLTELRMPIFDAFELVTHVRQNRIYEPLFVLVSSNLNRNIAIEAKRLGFAGILAKPLSPKILSERLTMIVANTARTNDKAAAEAPASL
jgi:CheY-like chemotaxis protein